jgi:hypothetical protein
LIALWLAILWLPLCGFAADLEFAGGLERVNSDSILIRLADGRRIEAKLPKAGPLAAGAISAQFKLADEVQITCGPEGGRCQDLKSLKFLRPPTPKERALVLGTPMPGGPPDPELEHARQVNLDRAANMPNFVADETAKRYAGRAGLAEWQYLDTIESEITIKGILVTRQNWRRNGKPVKTISGFFPGTGFGAELKPLFDPECPTTIDFGGREEARAKPALVYRFASPADGCFFRLNDERRTYNAGRAGRVLVEARGGNVIQYEEEASDFPAGYGFVRRNAVVSWDSVKIGDASYWLPVAADFIWRLPSGELSRVTIGYKKHRRFEADTSVTFHP